MQKTGDWHHKLHDYLVANSKTPFKWGSFDCALFTAGAVQAMTGVDTASDFRGKYSDEAGAKVTIASVTGVANGTVEDVVVYAAKKYGFSEIKKGVLCAQRGDVVVFGEPTSPAIGIVHLDGFNCLFVTDKGINKIPLRKVRRAWRIR